MKIARQKRLYTVWFYLYNLELHTILCWQKGQWLPDDRSGLGDYKREQEWGMEETIEKTFRGNGYVLYLDCGDVFTIICQNLSDCTV